MTSGPGEQAVTTSAALPGRQGEIQHVLHLDHGSGMTEHVGKMSEMSWVQRVRKF